MRGKAVFASKIKGECAGDIDISLCSENEKTFIAWAKVLQETITHLQQEIEYYDEFITYRILESKVYKKFNCFLTNYLTDLCIVMTVEIEKLCSSDNDLCLINEKILFRFLFFKKIVALVEKKQVKMFTCFFCILIIFVK